MKWFWIGLALFACAVYLLMQKQFIGSVVVSIGGMMALRRLKRV